MPEIRHVVIHSPGPNWQPGVPFFQQPGLMAHVEHYRQMLDAGTLALGGPFLSGAEGGMMVSEPGVDGEQLLAFALADPTVQSGLLQAEVRQWMIGMRK